MQLQMRAGRAGFSLLEMLIVVMILGLIATLVFTNLGKAGGMAKVKITLTQVSALADAVDRFQIDVERIPTEEEGLGVLLKNVDEIAKWDGPYIKARAVPKDGWKRDLVYKLDDEFGYLIVSYGADGKPGGEGDDKDIDQLTIE